MYPLFQAGKSLSSVLVGREVYPLFQAGKSLSSKVFYFRDESLSSVSGREEFIL